LLRRGAGRTSPVGGALAATGVGEESGGGGSLGHGQLLNPKIVTDLQEAGQGIGAAEVEADGGEPFVEAADDVEDESAVGDRFAEVAEILRLALVEPTVVSDGKVALAEVAEVGVGVQGACRLIAEKLRLDGEPYGAGGGMALGDGVAPRSQVRTTQSMRTQSAEVGTAVSDRTWRSREYLPRARRKDSRHRA